MSVKQPSRNTITYLITSFVGMALFYQNCAPAVPSRSEQLSQLSTDSPFAFDTTLDRIAYMSCSNMNGYDSSTFFTLKVAAHDKAGAMITQDFRNHVIGLSDAEKAQVLEQSSRNQKAQLQVAIRATDNLEEFFTATAGGGQSGVDYAYIWDGLETYEIGNALLRKKTGRLNSYSSIPLENNLYFTSSEGIANNLRQSLGNGSALLALTYRGPENIGVSPLLPRSPADYMENPKQSDFDKVYGYGYSLKFARASGSNSQSPARVLSSVEEVDLLSKSKTTSTWSCPSSLQLTIVRPTDSESGYFNCNRATTEPSNPSAEYKLARKILKVEDWYIDLNNRCVVPKNFGSCYGPINTLSIEYNKANVCGGTTGKECPHFVSICLQNP